MPEENRNVQRNTYPSATKSTKNPTLTEMLTAVRSQRLRMWAMSRRR